MLNLRNRLGQRVDVKVTADVASGSPANIGGVLGVPVEHALNGATVAFIQEGIVALTFSGQGTVGAGSYLYWDVSASGLSIGAAAADLPFGLVLGSDPDGGASVYLVKLMIGPPRAAAGNDQQSIAA